METAPNRIELPRGLVTALRTLTILPIPGNEAPRAADAVPWFPVVGAIIGIITWALIAALGQYFDWPNGLALIGILISVFITRGIHLDGLADWADAFWGGWNRERMLAIMKDSALGTFGTIALILVLLAKWCSIAAIIDNGSLHWLIVAAIVSRATQTDLAIQHDYARPEGGTAANFITGATKAQWNPAAISTLALVTIFGGFALRPIIVALLTLLIGRGFGRICRNRVGGMTGDLLGAASEITETSFLMLAAMLG